MEVTISKEKFLKAGGLSEKITGKNQGMPILGSFMVSAQKGKIKITATNLESAFEFCLPANKIEKEGKFVVPAKIINSAVFNFSEDFIDIKQDGSVVSLSSKNSTAVLKTNDINDFPVFPKFKKEKSFKITVKELLSGLKSVFFSCSLSYFKPEIASVYFYSDKNNLVFTATDSFRLAEKIINTENAFLDVSLLLPVKTVLELISILEEIEKQENEIEVCYNKNEFFVGSETFTFFSRLTEGVFPDYRQFIPKNFLGEVFFNTREILKILKASNVFISRLNDITLEIYPKEEIAEFRTANHDSGEYYSNAKISVHGFQGLKEKKIKMIFNLKYLLEGVSRVSSLNTAFEISEEGKPIVMRGEDDKSFFYLVMPMKL